jgi:hypothetical protein
MARRSRPASPTPDIGELASHRGWSPLSSVWASCGLCRNRPLVVASRSPGKAPYKHERIALAMQYRAARRLGPSQTRTGRHRWENQQGSGSESHCWDPATAQAQSVGRKRGRRHERVPQVVTQLQRLARQLEALMRGRLRGADNMHERRRTGPAIWQGLVVLRPRQSLTKERWTR